MITDSDNKEKKTPVFQTFNQKNGIQRLLLEGKIEAKRGCGRPRTIGVDNIKDWIGLKYGEYVQSAEDRRE